MRPGKSEPFSPSAEEQRQTARHLAIGQLGEEMACRLLWKRGYRILGRNLRFKGGEIDVVAERKGRVHFVEVKTRTSDSMGAPEERVDSAKRKALRIAAEEYLASYEDQPAAGAQFDVVALVVDYDKKRVVEQNLIEDAF